MNPCTITMSFIMSFFTLIICIGIMIHNPAMIGLGSTMMFGCLILTIISFGCK